MFQFKKRVGGDSREERQRVLEETKKAFDSAVGAAQSCLQQEDFLKYKQEYEFLEKMVIEELIFIDQTETDPVKYGFQCKEAVSKIRHIGSLLRGVVQDAGRK